MEGFLFINWNRGKTYLVNFQLPHDQFIPPLQPSSLHCNVLPCFAQRQKLTQNIYFFFISKFALKNWPAPFLQMIMENEIVHI